jgi:hypothetical protein
VFFIPCGIFHRKQFCPKLKWFTQLSRKRLLTESYFGKGRTVNDEWSYSVQRYLQEFQLQFPQLADNKQFQVSGVYIYCEIVLADLKHNKEKKGS